MAINIKIQVIKVLNSSSVLLIRWLALASDVAVKSSGLFSAANAEELISSVVTRPVFKIFL